MPLRRTCGCSGSDGFKLQKAPFDSSYGLLALRREITIQRIQ